MNPRADSIYDRALRAILTALCAFAVVLVIGTLGYKAFGGEEVGWTDAFYMTFLMVATIGYGAGIEVFHRPDREFFTMAIAFSGIGIMTYLFSSITALVLASDFDKSLRRRRMERQLKRINGHYILCGCGRVGSNVARELEATQHQFVAIDENEALLETQAERHRGLLHVVGDAADEDVLAEANIAGAKGVFAVTGDDSRNLMIALTARQMNPALRIVARCNDVRNGEKMRKAGADAIVYPDFTGGMRIASAMIRPHVVSFLDEMLRTEHNLRVEEVTVPAHFTARPLGEVHRDRSANYVLIALRVGKDWVFNPPGEFVLEAGQVLVAMTSPHGRRELELALSERMAAT